VTGLSVGLRGEVGAVAGVRATVGPINDYFANATVLTGSSLTVTGSNSNASKEQGEPNHGGNTGGRSVWYTWTAPTSGTVTIDTHGKDGMALTLDVIKPTKPSGAAVLWIQSGGWYSGWIASSRT